MDILCKTFKEIDFDNTITKKICDDIDGYYIYIFDIFHRAIGFVTQDENNVKYK